MSHGSLRLINEKKKKERFVHEKKKLKKIRHSVNNELPVGGIGTVFEVLSLTFAD